MQKTGLDTVVDLVQVQETGLDTVSKQVQISRQGLDTLSAVDNDVKWVKVTVDTVVLVV